MSASVDRSGPGLAEPLRNAQVGTDSLRGVAARVLIEVAGGRLSLPSVTIRCSDRSELTSGASAAVVVRQPAAVVRLLRAPGELGLARAWVDGSLDVDGDLEAVLLARSAFAAVQLSAADRARLRLAALRAAEARLVRRPPAPVIEARVRGRRQSLARDRDAVRHHYDLSNRFYRLVLGPTTPTETRPERPVRALASKPKQKSASTASISIVG